MQFSSDNKTWIYESINPFNEAVERAARSLGIVRGAVIYYREKEDKPVIKFKYAGK